ncbi:uncharacterized protein EDB91DRAFT_1336421 [Suillus paluster]|uniref:uncharacterized protein n=1 Tax=Suillus paluster TaxID=48578 RepID=UPI001B860058|nr:uncharacterized protein EDB91DRAFT_1336421 [Suillus paluster]KAG1740826.1 hypothetical protein EDB91DRAFT_1336421 [Suillus paluster]
MHSMRLSWSLIKEYRISAIILRGLQYPQMLSLALDNDTEIMWCDIGGPNKTLEFAAQFYNEAMRNGYQVAMNGRCGVVPDFDTPEYATFGSLSTRRWETSEGMDPFNYSLNAAKLLDQASQDPTGSFLTTPKTLCVIAFNNPSDEKITADAGGMVLPIQKGDSVVLL